MIRLKIENSPENFAPNIKLLTLVKNREYEGEILLLSDALSGALSYELNDDVGNVIPMQERKVDKVCEYQTIKALHEEYVIVGEWLFHKEKYWGVSATHYWDLSKFKGKKVKIKARYKVDEVMAAHVHDHFNKDIYKDDITSKEFELILPL